MLVLKQIFFPLTKIVRLSTEKQTERLTENFLQNYSPKILESDWMHQNLVQTNPFAIRRLDKCSENFSERRLYITPDTQVSLI